MHFTFESREGRKSSLSLNCDHPSLICFNIHFPDHIQYSNSNNLVSPDFLSLILQLQKAIEGSTRSGVRLRPPLASFRDASRKTKKHQPPSSSTASSPTRDRELWGEGSRRESELLRRESREDSQGKTPSLRGTPGSETAPSSPSSAGSNSESSVKVRGAQGVSQEAASPSTSSSSPSPPVSPMLHTSPVLTLSSLQEERESEESVEQL